jgi:hypothetical protein
LAWLEVLDPLDAAVEAPERVPSELDHPAFAAWLNERWTSWGKDVPGAVQEEIRKRRLTDPDHFWLGDEPGVDLDIYAFGS